jgi:hypothetical protein
MSPSANDSQDHWHPEYQLGMEADDWAVRIGGAESHGLYPFSNRRERNVAFLNWATMSPRRLSLFIKKYVDYLTLVDIDSELHIEVAALVCEAQEILEKREQDASAPESLQTISPASRRIHAP